MVTEEFGSLVGSIDEGTSSARFGVGHLSSFSGITDQEVRFSSA